MMFRFANPDFFYLLLALPLLVGVFVLSEWLRRKRLERFGEPSTVRALMPDASPARHIVKFGFLLAALVMLVFALARPQMGSKLKELKVSGIEMMLAVDVSNSMLARDFEPNRLERTKYAISRLLEGLEQDRVGLVVFAGDAYVQLPITSDYTTAQSFVRRISPTMVSRQGTAIGAAIDLAVSGFSSESEGSRVVILITDGENHEDDALAAARRAAERGIKIYTIGIGTPEGAPIEIAGLGSGSNSGSGAGDFIRDEEGNMVVSKLDEEVLQRIAAITGGAYIRSTNQSMGLGEIISKINETEKKEFAQVMFEEYDEQFAGFLYAALFFVIVSLAIPARKNPLLKGLKIGL